MRALLDTSTLIWWLGDEARLSQRARSVISQAGTQLFVSAASSWEISTKVRLGKLHVDANVLDELAGILHASGIGELPISLGHGLLAGSLEGPHKDPFGRIIAAQAIMEQLDVATPHRAIGDLGAATLW